MHLTYDRGNLDRKIKLAAGKSMTVAQLLGKLRINPETVVVAKNGKVVLEDEKLTDRDEVKIFSVVSGG